MDKIREYLEMLRYFKDNPHELERLNQCVDCKKLYQCNIENDDENGMCKQYIPLSS